MIGGPVRRLVAILCLLAGAVAAFAVEPRADAGPVLEALSRSAAGVETMTCRFVQTKHLSLLADKMVSQGTMAFSRPGRLRWEYTSPYSYRFVSDGSKVLVGNDERSNVMDAAANRMFGQIARVMIATVTGSIAESRADFDIAVSGRSPARVLTLTPKRREIKQLLKSVDVILDETAGTVSGITLREKNGDVTEIVLTDIILNKPLDASLFAIP